MQRLTKRQKRRKPAQVTILRRKVARNLNYLAEHGLRPHFLDSRFYIPPSSRRQSVLAGGELSRFTQDVSPTYGV